MIQQVDPPAQASVEVSGDLSVGAVNEMSYSQVLAVAQAYNIGLTRDDRGPSRGPPPRRLLTKPLNQAVQKPSSPFLVEEEVSGLTVLLSLRSPAPSGQPLPEGIPRERPLAR
jgi:hypothetical protein